MQYNSQCTKKHNYIETQPRAHVISSRKIGSGDRLGRIWLGLGGTDSIGVN